MLLLLVACCYYGYYYRCGLYAASEGGVEGMAALRLLSGQTPITEVALSYNLLWFYPIVLLFKIFGPNYLVMKGFFFVVATGSGLLAYAILAETTESCWIGLLGGLCVLLLPGQIFRNYMGFIPLLCLYTGMKAYLFPARSLLHRISWMIAAAMALSLTFLLRIDLGFFWSFLFLGMLLLYPFIQRKNSTSLFSALIMALVGMILLIGIWSGIHFPFLHYAEAHHFADEWWSGYLSWPRMILNYGNSLWQMFSSRLSHLTSSIWGKGNSVASPSLWNSESGAKAAHLFQNSKKATNLLRDSVVSGDIRHHLMALNLYLPILDAILLFFVSFLQIGRGIKKQNPKKERSGWILLVALGGSLTLFPQYFFWRPDMIHLSEFMVPMMVTLLMGLSFLWHSPMEEKERRKKKAALNFSIATYLGKSVVSFFLAGTFLLYFIAGIQSQSTGGIAVSQGRTWLFRGENGFHVLLTKNEWEETQQLYEAITDNTSPGDRLICFPYNPEVNFFTNRDSYRRDFYVDDCTVRPQDRQALLQEIIQKRPAAILVTDWPINGTEHSRFTVWAHDVFDYLENHYTEIYHRGIIHLFLLPEKLTRVGAPKKASVKSNN